jgi:magnesium chelatase subunit H
MLRFIPGTAQDVRAYFLTLQYWLGGSQENVFSLIRFLIDRYADGPRRALRGQAKVADPVDYPEVGVYHPRMNPRLSDRLEDLPDLPPGVPSRGTVGLLLL